MISSIKASTVPGYGDVVASYSDIEAAGAIHSLRWPVNATNGLLPREYLNFADDGRLMQFALVLNPDPAFPERNNPTEGGALATIGFSTPSASKLLQAVANGNILQTVNRMAYWKPWNNRKLSDTILTKKVTLKAQGVWNLIEVQGQFSLTDEVNAVAQFEFTGYMPATFSEFFTLDRVSKTLTPLSDGPGEQALPVVMSTPDGSAAMGIYTPAGTPGGGYGRWRFPSPDNCVKWNSVARVQNPVPGSIHKFRHLVSFGSKADVVQTLSGVS